MKKERIKPNNRRTFLRSLLRLGVLGGLVSIGIALGRRNTDNTAAGGKCPVTSSCEDCCQRSDCNEVKNLKK